MSATPERPNGPDSVRAPLLASYRTARGVYDELLDRDGRVRPHWVSLIDAFGAASAEEIRELHERAERLLRENDVTFVARGDRDRSGRPWWLDLCPLLIDAREWATIERGLIQRAELLNLILADIYGPQRSLKEHQLPPGLVFGNLRFLPPCSNIPVESGLYLHLLAFDIARSPDGTWWVLSNRTEAPSGAGFALENRVVSTRCLPELFARENVHRQASFFRAFSEHLLGLSKRDEPLLMPSIATWWCGQPKERDYVSSHLDSLVVKRISATTSAIARRGRGLVDTNAEQTSHDDLRRRIRFSGHDFVGQESLTPSTAPVFGPSHTLEAAPVVIRVYVAATADGYRAMPGGLARTRVGLHENTTWLDAGNLSKDTWVLSEGPAETFSLLAQRQDGARLRRGGKDLPSRAADNLFWLGRYAERAEAAVRLLRSLVIRLRGEIGSNRPTVSSERLVSLLVRHKHLSARRGRRAIREGREAVEQELWTILFDPESKDGLATVLGNVRRTADVVRERLSFDTYRILHDLTDAVHPWTHSPRREAEDALRLLNRLIQYLAAFNGMVMENMTRGYGWRFLDMGRRLERLRSAIALIQQLTVRGDPEGDGGLGLLLELADSTMTYRGRYLAAPRLPAVLDLLLADGTNPRSALFQVHMIADHLRHLPQRADDDVLTLDQRITTRISGELKLADVVKLGGTFGRFDTRVELDRLARRIEHDVGELSDYISQYFFSHSSPRRVAGARRGDRS